MEGEHFELPSAISEMRSPKVQFNPKTTHDIRRALFGEHYPPVVSKKTISLPPSMPSAPLQVDFTMFIISSAPSDSVARTSESPQFREFIALRKLMKRLESELVIAQLHVDAEVKGYYSNVKGKKTSSLLNIGSQSSSSQQSSKRVQGSSAFRHLKYVEKRFLAAHMKYLLLSVSILHKVSPHLSPQSSTVSSLPSSSFGSARPPSPSPSSPPVPSQSPIFTRVPSPSPNFTGHPSPSRPSPQYSHSASTSVSSVYTFPPPPYIENTRHNEGNNAGSSTGNAGYDMTK